MAEDVDPVALEAVPHDGEHPFADAVRELAVAEALTLGERRQLSLEEGPGLIERDAHAVDLELMERADHVVERRTRRRTQRRRDADVVLETDTQSEPRGVVEIPQDVVVVAHLPRPRKVIRDPVRPHRHRARALRQRDRAVGSLAVDVMIKETQGQGSGCPDHAASTSVQSTPDTRVCRPATAGTGPPGPPP